MASTTPKNDLERYYPVLDLAFGMLYVSVRSQFTSTFVEVFRKILEVGIVSSTAHIEDVEEQERKVGEIIANSGLDRKKFFVVIKVHAPLQNVPRSTRFTLQKLISKSGPTMTKTLERLRLGYVDLILLHDAHAIIDDRHGAFKYAWEILEGFADKTSEIPPKSQCRFRGLSNFDKGNFGVGNSEIAVDATFLRSNDFLDFCQFQERRDGRAYYYLSKDGSDPKLKDAEARKGLRDLFHHRSKYLHNMFTDHSISEQPVFMFLDPLEFRTENVIMRDFLNTFSSGLGRTPSDVVGQWARQTEKIIDPEYVPKSNNGFQLSGYDIGRIDVMFDLMFKIKDANAQKVADGEIINEGTT